MQRLIILIIIFSNILVGCAHSNYKDNQVYLVERDGEHKISDFQGLIDTSGLIPFEEINYDFQENDDLRDKILVNLNLMARKAYLMERVAVDNPEEVLLGENQTSINLLEYDLEKNSLRTIAQQVPFLTRNAWNHNGNFVAFNGSNRLVIYDTQRKRLLMENILRNDPVNYFFWSGNDNRIYSEHPGQVNGSIYYVNLQRKASAYEIKGNLYLKGILDENLFYATRWIGLEIEDNSEAATDSIYTVVVDSQNNIVKVIGKGIFRDAYKKSVLLVDTNDFGLIYIPNIDKPEEKIKLTEEYIYDVQFVHQGSLYYITKSNKTKNNLFTLHLINPGGKEVKSFELSSSALNLLPDGRIAYGNGYQEEIIDFTLHEMNVLNKKPESESNFNKTLRGAIDILYRNQVYGDNDWALARNYFLETEDESWEALKERTPKNPLPPYKSKIIIANKEIHEAQAKVSLKVEIINNSGDEYKVNYNFELIKKNNNWLITKRAES